VQIRSKTVLIQIGKWAFSCAGILGMWFAFATLLLAPGDMDLNRFLVAGLFASLATNALLISGLFFGESAEDGKTLSSILRTRPIIIAAWFLLGFILITATSPWWASR
jgi:hypothetical protein